MLCVGLSVRGIKCVNIENLKKKNVLLSWRLIILHLNRYNVSGSYVKIGKVIEIREKSEEAWGQNNVKPHTRLNGMESNVPKGIAARVKAGRQGWLRKSWYNSVENLLKSIIACAKEKENALDWRKALFRGTRGSVEWWWFFNERLIRNYLWVPLVSRLLESLQGGVQVWGAYSLRR